ncbi:MAG: hypothetical protein IT340_20860 [Chloroflexi bacterium]|nr:hypothetical protein [Chloroflexota bacterium]
MTLDEICSGIRDSIANARSDVKAEHADLLAWLTSAVDQRYPEKILAVLERLDIRDHYPARRQPDGRLVPEPMPGGWTSWYGWMMHIKAHEEAPYRARAAAAARADIPETAD